MARGKMTINFRQRMNRALEDPAFRAEVRDIRADALLTQLSRTTAAREGALKRLAQIKAEADADTEAPDLNLPPDIVSELPNVTTTEEPAPAE